MSTENASITVTNRPKPGKKYFSVQEATQALEYVSRVVGDITDRYRQAVEIRQQIEQAGPDQTLEDLRDAYEGLMDQLNEFIDELALVGVELKDFERGLIDFPALHEGREVYLCWHRGEQGIVAWHEIDSGFAGRQDVALLEDEAAAPGKTG